MNQADDYSEINTMHDAKLLTPFDINDPRYAQEMIVSTGANRESKNWIRKPMPVWRFVDTMAKHREDEKKDGLAFVLAEILGSERRKAAVAGCYGVGLDIDVGVPGEVIDEAMVKLGFLAIRYTTHSHAKASTKMLKDRITRWAVKNGMDEVNQDTIVRFLREESRWDESIIRSVEYVGDVQEPTGFMVDIHHIPMPKHRVVVPLAQVFEPAKVAKTHDEGMKMWGLVCHALAKALGDLPLDRSAVDPSRLFYFPRHAPNRPHETTIVGGDLLDWESLDLGDVTAVNVDTGKSKSTTEEGRALGRWSIKAATGFQIVDVIKDHAEERIRTNGIHKIDIECPFDEEHSDPGNPEDKGCFAVNAGDGPAPVFTIKCQHDACSQRTNLDFLGKMIKDDWFAAEVLDDDAYNPTVGDVTPPALVARAAEVLAKVTNDPPPEPITLDEVKALTLDTDECEVEAVAARIARLNPVPRARAIKALAKAAGIDTPTAKSVVARAGQDAREPPPPPSRDLAPLLAEIPLPSSAHGDFSFGTFDGAPWVFEASGDTGAARRLYTPWGVSGGAIYRDRDDRRGLRLTLLSGGSRLVDIDAPADLIADTKSFRAEMLARGIAFTPEGGERAASLVAQFQPSRPVAVFDRPGWREPGVFLTPWGEVIAAHDTEPAALARAGMPDGEAKAGTLEGWKDAVQAAFGLGNLQMQLGVIAGLTSPILDLSGYESRSLFFGGAAGRGKSTAHELQCSAWGDPVFRKGLFGTFAVSNNAPELLLQQASGAGCALDEVKQLKVSLQHFLFMVWSGTGKSRMDYRAFGLKEVTRWRCLFVTSYEDSLAKKIRQDGETLLPGLGARVLEIAADATELTPEAVAPVMAVRDNYGWAGPEFIRAMFEGGWVDDPEALRAAVEAKADILMNVRRSDQRRAAITAALMWQAAEIASDAGLIPEKFPLKAPATARKIERVVSSDSNDAGDLEQEEQEDQNHGAAKAPETDLERLMYAAWINATGAESAATDVMTKAVDTLIRNLVTGAGVTIADGPDGITRGPRLAFQMGIQPVPQGAYVDVYVIPVGGIQALAEAPVDTARLAKALDARGALLPYERSGGQDGRNRGQERTWPSVPGLGKVRALIVPVSAVV